MFRNLKLIPWVSECDPSTNRKKYVFFGIERVIVVLDFDVAIVRKRIFEFGFEIGVFLKRAKRAQVLGYRHDLALFDFLSIEKQLKSHRGSKEHIQRLLNLQQNHVEARLPDAPVARVGGERRAIEVDTSLGREVLTRVRQIDRRGAEGRGQKRRWRCLWSG